ncbi:MAG: HI0074 family nucleotidyltransferase substrate-binding subunit [Betaproteobacteria bacterium]
MTQYSDRTLLELRKFDEAVAALEEAVGEDESRKARDSLLLRYVYTFEMAWQAMRLVLTDRGDTETPKIAFATLETAFVVGMIHDPALWKDMREARNAVVHAYDEDKAIALAAFVRNKAFAVLKRLAVELRAGNA